ncbi:MAG: phosphate acyltransferase PlsX [Candidatus Marinimicrobia bacterium]|nr:phosphate acyltransferase PlsX [Candidatus Neomarinimicrobiota bacterium]
MSEMEKREYKDIVLVLDAMGGDHAPKITVKGACKASLNNEFKIKLVGDKDDIQKYLGKYKHDESKIEIVHASDQIKMGDHPKDVLKNPNTSIGIAAKIVGDGNGDALISAGNTGAVILASTKNINRIVGVRRTALATIYPTHNSQKRSDIFSLIMDVGANVHNSAHEIIHFAFMGNAYVQAIKGIESPTIGLLNIGEEEYKGGEVLSRANRILRSIPSINFYGNIEGNDLMRGIVDVVVTEGITGNIAIKTIEGMAGSMKKVGQMAFKHNMLWKMGMVMLAGGIKKLQDITDFETYGGAPVFGFEKTVIKCHGRSTEKSIYNALVLSAKSVHENMSGKISESIANYEHRSGLEEMGRETNY